MRRDKMQIMISILDTCTKGANKTRIVYQVNLNFRTVRPYLELLEKSGLIEVKDVKNNGSVLYETTQKGTELIENYSNISEMLRD